MQSAVLGFPGGSGEGIHLPMQEVQVGSLGREDPLKKEMASHSSILAWEVPWTEEPGRLQFMGSQRFGHDLSVHTHTHIYGKEDRWQFTES